MHRCTFNGQPHLLFEAIPEFGGENDLQKPKEVVFVVDCSGSMEGSAIKEAVNALQLSLRALNEGDLFQVVCFGSNFQMLFQEPQLFSQASLDAATRAIAEIDADLGGTEILPALRAAVKAIKSEYASMILFTDGAVGNEKEVIDFVASQKHRCRIFSFGIGNGASHNLIMNVARESAGMAEFVFDGERIEPKVLNQFRRLSAPVLSNIQMDWGGADIEKTVGHPPVIFSGDVVRFAARCQEGDRLLTATTATEVKLTAQYNNRSFAWKADGVSDTGNNIPALWWAKQRIQELEHGVIQSGSRQTRRQKKEPNSEVIKLSKDYGIISSKTALVGIEERNTTEKNDGKPELRRIPVLIPAGRDFLPATSYPSHSPAFLCQDSFLGVICREIPQFLRRRSPRARSERIVGSRLANICASVADFVCDASSKSAFKETDDVDNSLRFSPVASAGTASVENLLVEILMHANASGIFTYSQELLDLLVATDEEFAEYLAKVSRNRPENERRDMAMTLLVRQKLETSFSSQTAMWSAIANKIDRQIKSW